VQRRQLIWHIHDYLTVYWTVARPDGAGAIGAGQLVMPVDPATLRDLAEMLKKIEKARGRSI